MKKDYQLFESLKTRIAVILPHGTEKAKSYWEKEDFPFIGIPDPDGTIGNLYGQEWNLMKLGRMPALFIVDKKGKITFSQYAKSMADIPENTDLLKVLK